MYGNLKFIYDETPLQQEKKGKDKKEQKQAAYMRFDQLYGDGKRKQIKIDEMKDEQKLNQMLSEIELEESKMGISNISKKLTASRRPEQFYEYNKQWALKVNEKKQQQRTEQFNHAINQQAEMHQKSQQQRNFYQETLLTNYTGPISGWQSRFENYLNTKIKLQEVGEQENTFKPKINENSKKMTSYRDTTPIEQRLLKYGEELKMKQEIIRQQMDIINQESDEFGQKKPSINKNYVYGESDGSKVHDKLYEYAKVYDQKIQDLKNEAQNQFNFKPELNPVPQHMADKLQQKRKPLYEPKKKEIVEEKKPSKQFNVQNFEQFLERNYTQFERKLERQQQKEDVEKELELCSFQPQINKKSATQSVMENEKQSIYERELEKQEKKKQALEKLKSQQVVEDSKNCTFKPQKNFNIAQERKQLKEQAKKDLDKKKNIPAINYPKVRSKTPVTQRQNSEYEYGSNNYKEYDDEIQSDEQNKRSNQGGSSSDEEKKDQFQNAFSNRYKNNTLTKSVNFVKNSQVSSPGRNLGDKKTIKKQRSPLKRQSPSPKTVFKSNSSAKKNDLNQSKNDSDSKNNHSFLNNLLNSQLQKGNFNLESLLNQSIQNWGDQYNLSPSKMSKKKILDEFNQIEKEIQTIVKEVDQIKEKEDSNDNGIHSGTLPKSHILKNHSSIGNEPYDSKLHGVIPQIIIEDHHNES